jgi:hypothetical protein
MKSLVLRSCILGPYVPLRTSSKRKRVANELCSVLHNLSIKLCKLTIQYLDLAFDTPIIIYFVIKKDVTNPSVMFTIPYYNGISADPVRIYYILFKNHSNYFAASASI